MNSYLLLLGAITLDVVGTLLLPAAQGFNKLVPSILVVGSYEASSHLLSIVSLSLSSAHHGLAWAFSPSRS